MGNSVVSTTQKAYLLGDLDNSGNVDAADLTILTKYLNEPDKYQLNEYQLAAANVYKDDSNSVDQEDANALSNYLLGGEQLVGTASNMGGTVGTNYTGDIGAKYVCPASTETVKYELVNTNQCKIETINNEDTEKDLVPAEDDKALTESGESTQDNANEAKNEIDQTSLTTAKSTKSVSLKIEQPNKKNFDFGEEVVLKGTFTVYDDTEYYYNIKTYSNNNVLNYQSNCFKLKNGLITNSKLAMVTKDRKTVWTVYKDNSCSQNIKEFSSNTYGIDVKNAAKNTKKLNVINNENITLNLIEPESTEYNKNNVLRFITQFKVKDNDRYYYKWVLYKNSSKSVESNCNKIVNNINALHSIKANSNLKSLQGKIYIYTDKDCKNNTTVKTTKLYKLKTEKTASKSSETSSSNNKTTTKKKTTSKNSSSSNNKTTTKKKTTSKNSSSKTSKKTTNPTKEYTCPEGYLLYEPNEYVHMCYKAIVENASYDLIYSCSQGYTKVKAGQSESTAYCQKKVNAKKRVVSTYCESGYTKVGGATCKKEVTPITSTYCSKGYTKVKSGQSESTAYCQKKVNAKKRVVRTYCESGYTKVGGATCKKEVTPITSTYCSEGYTKVKSGQSESTAYCQKKVNATKEKYVANTYCKSGYTKVGGATCQKKVAATKIPGTNQYKCYSGKLSGKYCIETKSLSYEYGTRYTCKKGSLSGSSCILTKSLKSKRSCPSGYSKAGNKCVKYSGLKEEKAPYCKNGYLSEDKKFCIISTSISEKKNYFCPSGSTLDGTNCLSPDTSTEGSYATLIYSCPKGYKKSGTGLSTTCTKTN